MYALNVYDHQGKVRRDLDPAEIAKCSKQQQTILFAMLKSLEIAEVSETAHYEAGKMTRKAVTALDRSRKAYETALPKRTFHDEWRETVAKLPPKVITDETKKAIADALFEVEKAEVDLTDCQRAEHTTRQDQKVKREAFAKAAIAWSPIDGIPKNVGDLVKARSATERRIAMENIAAGLPADHAVAQASTVGPSFLDQLKAGQGKGHSANRGFHRNALRGYAPPPKLPSEQ